jgi:hypothetical protein
MTSVLLGLVLGCASANSVQVHAEATCRTGPKRTSHRLLGPPTISQTATVNATGVVVGVSAGVTGIAQTKTIK